MIERITKNEERLDNILLSIKNVEEALDNLKSNSQNISLLDKYYGSKKWLNDKEAYEKGNIPKIKAGVLSEDAVWNMFEELHDLIDEMQEFIDKFKKNK